MEKGQKVALLAIGVNLVLFGLKYIFAALSGSIALKAEAFHSFSDVIASSTVFAGLILARRKTRSFPYFVLVTVSVKDKRVRERKVIANPFMHVEHGKGILENLGILFDDNEIKNS